MAKAQPALLQHFLSLTEDWAPCRARAMFGGYGIYRDEQIFAIYIDERVYLKTDANTRSRFDAEGLEPFVFTNKAGESMTMSYCRLPDAALDDPDECLPWLRLAWQAACAQPTKKRSTKNSRNEISMKTIIPPREQKSPYITRDGAERLRAELRYLLKVKRPEVTSAVSVAAAMGDRSENAEYIYGKRQLREIDRRLRFLEKRLQELTVVERAPADQTRIYFAAWVDLETAEGRPLPIRIVGPDEIDTEKGWISIDSPLARALVKKAVDDEVVVRTPAGQTTYFIVAIRYQSAANA